MCIWHFLSGRIVYVIICTSVSAMGLVYYLFYTLSLFGIHTAMKWKSGFLDSPYDLAVCDLGANWPNSLCFSAALKRHNNTSSILVRTFEILRQKGL